ncbi:MAG: methyltransferase domain-containing protein [SAR202 cluster bacterium]|nr:methyltransferase domain-containing protein [SAR202 cluster bacterium]
MAGEMDRTATIIELQTVPGLEQIAAEEAVSLLGAEMLGGRREGRVAISAPQGSVAAAGLLKTSLSANVVETFNIAGPNALLSPKLLPSVLHLISTVVNLHPGGPFQTSRVSAAGSDSPVFRRLRREIAAGFGLHDTTSEGDLLISVRRSLYRATGWDVLVRTTARPLSARAWRVCDFPGALNACVAAAMVKLAGTNEHDRLVNLACGSGTLLIERLALGRAASAVGIDIDARTLECAAANMRAAGVDGQVSLVKSDAADTGLDAASVDRIVADLPYGMLHGSGEDLASLYDAVLAETARIAVDSGAFVAITSNTRLFEPVLEARSGLWRVEQVIPLKIIFKSGFLHPRIYALRRQGR